MVARKQHVCSNQRNYMHVFNFFYCFSPNVSMPFGELCLSSSASLTLTGHGHMILAEVLVFYVSVDNKRASISTYLLFVYLNSNTSFFLLIKYTQHASTLQSSLHSS